MPTYAIGIEYHGTVFHGWQRQADQNTVQGDLEKALSQVANSEVLLSAAGRTDAGVHSMGQVASFCSDSDRGLDQWLRGVNSLTPQSINVTWIIQVEDTFHARFSAAARRYLYLFMDRKQDVHASDLAWSLQCVDADLMHWHAQNLLGEHDFTSFRGAGCQADSPYRRVNRCLVKRVGDLIVLDIEANAFLLHMVRNIAGVLTAVANGSKPITWAEEVLQSRDRSAGGVTALPDGLYFSGVRYPEAFKIPLPPEPCKFW